MLFLKNQKHGVYSEDLDAFRSSTSGRNNESRDEHLSVGLDWNQKTLKSKGFVSRLVDCFPFQLPGDSSTTPPPERKVALKKTVGVGNKTSFEPRGFNIVSSTRGVEV